MKKAVFFIALFLITISANAQITEIKQEVQETIQISKINLLGNLIGQLNKKTDSDYYTVSYKDFKTTDKNDIKTFAIGNKETVKQYRDIMLAMIANKTNEKTIALEGNTISFKRKSNSIETLITNAKGETSQMKWITPKHINMLFPENKLN